MEHAKAPSPHINPLRQARYRALISAIALFVLLDLGVLAMNYVTATGLTRNATAVNLAGRQRMLSQRIAKAALQAEASLREGEDAKHALDELENARALFDLTLNALLAGGTTLNSEGVEVMLPRLRDPALHRLAQQAQSEWAPLNQALRQLQPAWAATSLNDLRPQLNQLNLRLLKQMNDLTSGLEAQARREANTLRLVQAGGIVLAMINFFLILFHFLRVLRKADAQAEQARQETLEILDTVADGLFLLDRDLRIGSQHSQALTGLLQVADPAGQRLTELLAARLSTADLKLVEDYIALLFQPHINEKLIGTLNPLGELRMVGEGPTRYLAFNFKRVRVDGALSHLLVTVHDVSSRVELAQRRQQQSDEAELQLDLITALLGNDRDSVQGCLARSRTLLDEINERLRRANRGGVDQATRTAIARALHTLKGEAGCLGLGRIEQLAHQAEQTLAELGQEHRGEVYLPLLVRTEQLHRVLDQIDGLSQRLQQLHLQEQLQRAALPAAEGEPMPWAELSHYAQRIAADCGKRVVLQLETGSLQQLPLQYAQQLRQAAVQLVRNAIVHGIESPVDRQAAGKHGTGSIRLQAEADAEGRLLFSVRDDGAGIDLNAIRQQALQRGLIDSQQAESMSEVQLMSLIFRPGFSTAAGTDLHAGRGVGLEVVRSIAQSLGGRLRIASRKQRYCEFSLVLPLPAAAPSQEAGHARAHC